MLQLPAGGNIQFLHGGIHFLNGRLGRTIGCDVIQTEGRGNCFILIKKTCGISQVSHL